MRRSLSSLAVVGAVLASGCAEPPADDAATSPLGISAKKAPAASNPGVEDAALSAIRELALQLDARFGSESLRLHSAAWYGDPGQESMGNTVFFEDRGNKNLTFEPIDPRGVQWVPGDPRRGGRTNLEYATFPAAPAGLTPADVDAAIDRAIETWNGVNCSRGLTIEKIPFAGLWDIANFGFSPLAPPTIASTFFFVFVDPATGILTDIDSDGNLDYGLAIIIYSSLVSWGIDTNAFPFVDFETVALHETGHALAQGHFGKAFQTRNGKVHFAPRAVMNAGYSGLQQSIGKTDNGGHCSIWASWPNG